MAKKKATKAVKKAPRKAAKKKAKLAVGKKSPTTPKRKPAKKKPKPAARKKTQAKPKRTSAKVPKSLPEFVADRANLRESHSSMESPPGGNAFLRIPRDAAAARDALRSRFKTADSDKRRSRGLDLTATGVGLKTTGGSITGEVAVKVYVSKKLPKSKLPKASLIPKLIDGIPTDVEEIGNIETMSSGFRQHFTTPIPCGTSSAHFAVGAGTLGALVALDDGSLAVLSNNHVFANVNRAVNQEKILHPSKNDGGTLNDFIGIWARHVPLAFGANDVNYVDAAVGYTQYALVQAAHVTYELNPEPLSPGLGHPVMKNGRATGETKGTIMGVIDGISVKYANGRSAKFNEQLIIKKSSPGPFCLSGDSGSLVVCERTHRPIGLLFASDGDLYFANPIRAVMSALGIAAFESPT